MENRILINIPAFLSLEVHLQSFVDFLTAYRDKKSIVQSMSEQSRFLSTDM